MPVKTATEMLELIDAAIESITVRGQNYTVDGRSMGKGDLGTLFDMRKHYKPLADRETRGGAKISYGTPQ